MTRTEAGIPASGSAGGDCGENDVGPRKQHPRRVSWSPQDAEIVPAPSAREESREVPSSPVRASAAAPPSSVLEPPSRAAPTAHAFPPIESIRVDTEPDDGFRIPKVVLTNETPAAATAAATTTTTAATTTAATIAAAAAATTTTRLTKPTLLLNQKVHESAVPDRCTTRMDRQKSQWLRTRLVAGKPAAERGTTASDAEHQNQALRQRASKLRQGIRSLQTIGSVQKSKTLVRDYELRAKLEALAEDVMFLRHKQDKLGKVLLELHLRKLELLGGGGGEESTIGENDPVVPAHRRGVSDASVQTDDWLGR